MRTRWQESRRGGGAADVTPERAITLLTMNAIDARLVNPNAGVASPKLQTAAQRVVALRENNRVQFTATGTGTGTGTEERTQGEWLQLVYCDVANEPVAGMMRDLLQDRGIPADRIRSTADASAPEDFGKLLDDCRMGQVSVLLTDTNSIVPGFMVHDHAIAVHYLDCPRNEWDLKMREGSGEGRKPGGSGR
jgi:hypothetical protein